jgi:hypothetical protein
LILGDVPYDTWLSNRLNTKIEVAVPYKAPLLFECFHYDDSCLDVVLKLLRSDIVDDKVQALHFLNSRACEVMTTHDISQNTNKVSELANWIIHNNVIEIIYGKKLHTEVSKKY